MCFQMRLCLCLALVATCLAIDQNVGHLTPRNTQDAINLQIRCFVGIVSDYNNTSIGTEVFCDGLCGSISTSAGGYKFTTYNCFPTSFCSSAGLIETCATIQADRDLTGCCCGRDNCNVVGTNINTNIPMAPPEEPITCYSDMVDRCNDIEPGIVRGCCCTTDACIDPTMNPPKEPRGPLSCYVGLYSRAASISVGQEVVCDGHCASFSAAVAGGDIVVFECVPKETCQALTLYNDCHTVQADRDITACCCDNANNCNAASYWLGDPNPYVGDFPIACYSGIRVNGQFITPAKWIACHGDCASIMINTTMAMGPMSAEILTCHPASVCNQLGIADNCAPVEAGVSACCCGYDACIDPTRFPNKYPGDPLKCYVGFQSTYNGGITVGSEVYCNGMCGALNAMVNGQNITTYMCTPRSICRQLELYDTWMPLPRDREVSALCCDNFNNCNVRDPSVDTTMPVRSLPEFPITCYSGIQVNGNWIANAGWESCNGNCASMNIVTQFAGQTHNLTVYKCDPSAVCEGLKGLFGVLITNIAFTLYRNPIFVGIRTYVVYISYPFASCFYVYCNGKCASLRGMVNGDDVTTFQCVPTSTCRSLELDDACMPLPVNREFRVCCCDNVNSCNLALQNRTDIIVSPTPSPIVEYPISCWTGIYVNGSPLTEVGQVLFQTCNGQCASITMNTTLSGLSHTASMYMCNPTAICKSLNMINNCSVLEPGLGGCCCNSDACIYPPRNKIPGIPLQCYVGLYAPNAGVNVGAEVVCDGQCFSLSGMINGDKVTTFHCAPLNICKSLELDNVCSGLRGDREITACCCDSSNSCNIAGYASVIAPPTAPPLTEFPIACWSGMYLNGAAITDAGYQSCSGSCASMTLQTTIFSNQHNVTLYACDPTSVCQALSMSNKCATVEPGVTGCCCDSDACLTPWKSPSNNLYAGLNTSKANTNDGGEERKTTDLKSRSRDV
ncbi:hypothetical protein Y032_0004g1989 [Ancylostoma ceylanicum]|uniref:ET module n=4 Tax=Ancylostoma ceylanicum TaxID=53326 RepID=A0A016VUT4_9BILA|nr:hypothetical protein Y032_0004g1989 [Ancylostoma ceylanicum]